MFSINGGEFLVLIVVALIILGPERLPQYAQQLGKFVREAKGFALKAREQVKAEMGEEFDDVDWQALDPRRYDPRRIVRDALFDGDDDPLGLSDSAPHVPANMRPDVDPAASTGSSGAGDGPAADVSPAASVTEGGSDPQAYDLDAT